MDDKKAISSFVNRFSLSAGFHSRLTDLSGKNKYLFKTFYRWMKTSWWLIYENFSFRKVTVLNVISSESKYLIFKH